MKNVDHVEDLLKEAIENHLNTDEARLMLIGSIAVSLASISDELEALRIGKKGSD